MDKENIDFDALKKREQEFVNWLAQSTNDHFEGAKKKAKEMNVSDTHIMGFVLQFISRILETPVHLIAKRWNEIQLKKQQSAIEDVNGNPIIKDNGNGLVSANGKPMPKNTKTRKGKSDEKTS